MDKNISPSKLFWVDLEMTGLDPKEDLILEVTAIVTDFDFKVLNRYDARLKYPSDQVTEQIRKNTWWEGYPENRDDFLANLDQGKDPAAVEQDLIDLVQAEFGEEPAVLAGNSIYNDRRFIREYWPNLELKLHYRMLDVSAWKVLMQGKFHLNFDKKEAHRSLDDIQASIAELEYYLEWFKGIDE